MQKKDTQGKQNIVQKIKNTKYLTDFQVTFYELQFEQE